MKRIALLVTLLLVVFLCTPLSALPPQVDYRTPSVTRVLAQYLAVFMRIGNPVYIDINPVIIKGDNNDSLLGGDADDYAHGKGGQDDNGVDINGLGGPDQSDEILNAR
ncbi:MAG: hypothetical protein JXB45_02255 [Candidatus Krumholzibacteriota bacterium]|nr:hypothetical protein [Candidatus Krumholzibacteriota bacterium]